MKYRPDIDGLRAVAVVPVIFFHAGFELFSGGFVGVDVFFVISGYLITSIIVNEMEQNKFSLLTFYERRARRILPALFVVVLCCLPFAWFVLLPSDMENFAESLVAVATFSSNIFFWRESGYFDTAAELKPLLHTWSLAVEEQFYILFPLFLMAAWWFGRRAIVWTVVAAFVISLATAHWGAYNHPSATFYLLPTRAWELLIGSFAAFYLQKRFICTPPWLNNLLSAVGLASIVYAVFAFGEATPFPSLFALVPTVGTMLVILFATPRTLAHTLLSLRALVGLGLVSYSLYLWHQPMFAFYRYFFMIELDTKAVILICGILVIVAFLTYRMVEKPARTAYLKRTYVLTSSAITLVAISLVGGFALKSEGFPNRFADYINVEKWENIHPCFGEKRVSKLENYLDYCLGRTDGGYERRVFLVGDSHAHQFVYPLQQIGEQQFFSINFINTENAELFPRNFFTGKFDGRDEVFERILFEAAATDLIIIGFHKGHFNKNRDAHIATTEIIEEQTVERLFVESFILANAELRRRGINVLLVLDSPLLPEMSILERCVNIQLLRDACGVEQEQDFHTRTRQQRTYESLAQLFENVYLYDASEPLFEGGFFNPIVENGNYLMFDSHHLTESGSLLLKDSLYETIDKISQ